MPLVLALLLGAAALGSGILVVAARRRRWSESMLGVNCLALGGIALLVSCRLAALGLGWTGLFLIVMALQEHMGQHANDHPAPRKRASLMRTTICVLLLVGLAGSFLIDSPTTSTLVQSHETHSQTTATLLDTLYTHYGPGILGIALLSLTIILAQKRPSCPSG